MRTLPSRRFEILGAYILPTRGVAQARSETLVILHLQMKPESSGPAQKLPMATALLLIGKKDAVSESGAGHELALAACVPSLAD
jgi:hypothetical protein